MNRFLGLVLLPLVCAQQGPTYDALKGMVETRTGGGACPGDGVEFEVCGPDTVWDNTTKRCVDAASPATFCGLTWPIEPEPEDESDDSILIDIDIDIIGPGGEPTLKGRKLKDLPLPIYATCDYQLDMCDTLTQWSETKGKCEFVCPSNIESPESRVFKTFEVLKAECENDHNGNVQQTCNICGGSSDYLDDPQWVNIDGQNTFLNSWTRCKAWED